jgi:hypothetical protein
MRSPVTDRHYQQRKDAKEADRAFHGATPVQPEALRRLSMPTAIRTELHATVDPAPADTMPAKAPVIVLAGRSKPARSRAHRRLSCLIGAFRGYGCALAGRLFHDLGTPIVVPLCAA